jgi:hypothetical protein
MRNEFVINPKSHRKSNSLIVFLSIFGLMWFVGSVFGVRKLSMEFSIVGSFICLLSISIAVLTIFILLLMNRKQFVIVEDDHLLITDKRFAWANRSIAKDDLLALQLQYAGAGASLMFVYRKENRPDIVPIAPFVGQKGKIQLQQDIAKFLKFHGLKFDVVDKTEK